MILERWTWRRALPLALLAAALLALAAACGGDDGDGDSSAGERLAGSVAIDGSSTVFPVSEAVAEEFGKLHRDVRVTVGVSGTGGGFEQRVGLDGLAVVANPAMEWMTEITMEELGTLWGPDAEESVTRWNQVRPDWPDEKIVLFGPDVDSGTFDFFTEGQRRVEGFARGLHELRG